MDVVKVLRSFDLGGYAAEYAGQVCVVWVNMPMALRRQRADLLRAFAQAAQPVGLRWVPGFVREFWMRRRLQAAQAEMCAWLAEVWSQSADAETHWSAAEVAELQRLEPTLYAWMVQETVKLVDAWAAGKKK